MKTSHVLLALFILFLGGCKPAANPETIQQALSGAQSWLALVDEGSYAESWDQSAQLFQNAVGETQWVGSIRQVRNPLGQLKSRELISTDVRTNLPGAPDGEYVVLQFRTVFEHKQKAIETVTPMRDFDGVWRVSGYFLK